MVFQRRTNGARIFNRLDAQLNLNAFRALYWRRASMNEQHGSVVQIEEQRCQNAALLMAPSIVKESDYDSPPASTNSGIHADMERLDNVDELIWGPTFAEQRTQGFSVHSIFQQSEHRVCLPQSWTAFCQLLWGRICNNDCHNWHGPLSFCRDDNIGMYKVLRDCAFIQNYLTLPYAVGMLPPSAEAPVGPMRIPDLTLKPRVFSKLQEWTPMFLS